MQIDYTKSMDRPQITTSSTIQQKDQLFLKTLNPVRSSNQTSLALKNKSVVSLNCAVEDTVSVLRLRHEEIQNRLKELGITSFELLQAFVQNPENEPLSFEIKAWGELRPEVFQPFFEEIRDELQKDILKYITYCVEEKEMNIEETEYLSQIQNKTLWIPSGLLEKYVAPILKDQLQYVKSQAKMFRVIKQIAELSPEAVLQHYKLSSFLQNQQVELLFICSKSGLRSLYYIVKTLYHICYSTFQMLLDNSLKYATPDQFLLFDIKYIEDFLTNLLMDLDGSDRKKINEAQLQVETKIINSRNRVATISARTINPTSQIDKLIDRYLLHFFLKAKAADHHFIPNMDMLHTQNLIIETFINLNGHSDSYPITIELSEVKLKAMNFLTLTNNMKGNNGSFIAFKQALIEKKPFPLTPFINVTFLNRNELLEALTGDIDFCMEVFTKFDAIDDETKKILILGIIRNQPIPDLTLDAIQFVLNQPELKQAIFEHCRESPLKYFSVLSKLEPKLSIMDAYILFIDNADSEISELTPFDESTILDNVNKASNYNPTIAKLLGLWNSHCDFTARTNCTMMRDFILEAIRVIEFECEDEEGKENIQELQSVLGDRPTFYMTKFEETVAFIKPRLSCLMAALISSHEHRVIELLYFQSKENSTELANLELTVLTYALLYRQEPALSNLSALIPQTLTDFLSETLILLGIDLNKKFVSVYALKIIEVIDLLKIIELFSKYPKYRTDQLQKILTKALNYPPSIPAILTKLNATLPICNVHDFDEILNAGKMELQLDNYLEQNIKILFKVENDSSLKAILSSHLVPYFTHFYSQLRKDLSVKVLIECFNAFLAGESSLLEYRFSHGKNATQFASFPEGVVEYYKSEHEFKVSDYYPEIQKIAQNSILSLVHSTTKFLLETTKKFIQRGILAKVMEKALDNSEVVETIKSMSREQIIAYFKEIKKHKKLNKNQNEHIALFKFVKYLVDLPSNLNVAQTIALFNEVENFVGSHGHYFDNPPFELSTMTHEIGNTKQILQASDKEFPHLKCLWTHNPETLLTFSDKVIGSCQGIMSYSSFIETLIGRISHGKQKMLVLYDDSTRKEFGALTTKILNDRDGKPFILIEPAYICPGSPLPSKELFKIGIAMVLDSATKHNIQVVADSAHTSEFYFNTEILPFPLESKLGEAEAEYEDFGRIGETYADYHIKNAALITKKE